MDKITNDIYVVTYPEKDKEPYVTAGRDTALYVHRNNPGSKLEVLKLNLNDSIDSALSKLNAVDKFILGAFYHRDTK